MADLGLSPELAVECTGVVPFIQQVADAVAPGGIVCLERLVTGRVRPADLDQALARRSDDINVVSELAQP